MAHASDAFRAREQERCLFHLIFKNISKRFTRTSMEGHWIRSVCLDSAHNFNCSLLNAERTTSAKPLVHNLSKVQLISK